MVKLDSIEEHNLNEIQKLNQRGGRMLSIIDLLKDGTVDPETAGFLTYAMLHNMSFLTCANPSGTGKTTLMGSLLNLLKSGIKIQTVTDKNPEGNKEKGKNIRYLVHEIGTGPYYSYVWGEKARKFFEISSDPSKSIASCIHADTLEELENILLSQIGVSRDTFNNIELILFMRMRGDYGNRKRRVSHIYESCNKQENHRLIYRWKESSDEIVQTRKSLLLGQSKEEKLKTEGQIEKFSRFLSDLEKENITKIENVRSSLLSFIGR